jgi:V8-like Glu-specific endopeptidase
VAKPFGGMSAVGALFTVSRGKLRHFCTAAVVRSPRGNLVITAAHCLLHKRLGPHGNVTFAPGYHDGKFPNGRWVVMSQFVDSKWRRTRNPNDDVAFLVVGRPGRRIEKYTGAETVQTSVRLPEMVQVIGYPDGTSAPVRCTATAWSAHPRRLRQLVFDCGGYTGGTSGGPFLLRLDGTAGTDAVIGVIGGYEEGGGGPAISYSPQFLRNVADLYKRAVS